MTVPYRDLRGAVGLLVQSANQRGWRRRNLQMPGDPRYQPKTLRPYLGYDQRVGWLIIVAWFWVVALAKHGVVPKHHVRLMTRERLKALLFSITETMVERKEKKTGHDVVALLFHMRKHLPTELWRWLHLALTSFDLRSTADALCAQWTFSEVFLPEARKLDVVWRGHIRENIHTLEAGRTHLVWALPMTVGFWLSVLHSRFAHSVKGAQVASTRIPGKFSGAVGSKAAIRVFVKKGDPEATALALLGLPEAMLSTQVTQPEGLARFYFEIVLISAAIANLGEDVRHLQASDIAEVISASSTSSTMSHKTSNPVAAEQMDGMFVTVRCDFDKVMQTLNSTLQRVLTGSNVSRTFPSILVNTFQQLLTAQRMFGKFQVNAQRCRENFWLAGRLVVAELLHLSLQVQGYPGAHTLVNKRIVPRARVSGNDLVTEMDGFIRRSKDQHLRRSWAAVPGEIKDLIQHPDRYLGDAVPMAKKEARNKI